MLFCLIDCTLLGMSPHFIGIWHSFANYLYGYANHFKGNEKIKQTRDNPISTD